MKRIMVTRFNNYTWRENTMWRERNEHDGCIYNCPVYIKENVPLMTTIYVVEMNNDTNKILGIGKIVNRLRTDKSYIIYDDRNYNRYTYKGKQRLDIKDIYSEKLEKLEERLFTTKSHLKRGQGITQVPDDITREYLEYIDNLYSR